MHDSFSHKSMGFFISPPPTAIMIACYEKWQLAKSNNNYLFTDYSTFEKTTNPILAEKMLERSRDYLKARRVAKEFEAIIRGINKTAPCVPPTGQYLCNIAFFLTIPHPQSADNTTGQLETLACSELICQFFAVQLYNARFSNKNLLYGGSLIKGVCIESSSHFCDRSFWLALRMPLRQ